MFFSTSSLYMQVFNQLFNFLLNYYNIIVFCFKSNDLESHLDKKKRKKEITISALIKVWRTSKMYQFFHTISDSSQPTTKERNSHELESTWANTSSDKFLKWVKICMNVVPNVGMFHTWSKWHKYVGTSRVEDLHPSHNT